MTQSESATPSWSFTIAFEEGRAGPFLPEQAMGLTVTLASKGSSPQTVMSISGNLDTPVLRTYDATGRQISAVVPQLARERALGHVKEKVKAPKLVTLDPGGKASQSNPINLLKYTDRLGPDAYAVDALHDLQPDGSATVTSNRLTFSIEEARVVRSALGFDSPLRTATILAWVAVPTNKARSPEVLVRLSGPSHGGTHMGGTSMGPVPADARVAVSEAGPGAAAEGAGWVAVLSPGASEVELIQHEGSIPEHRTGRVKLAITDPVPVPRFPDRGHAVFLATGRAASGGGALAGLVVEADAAQRASWTVPLGSVPRASACIVGAGEQITVFFTTDDGKTASVWAIEVDESGKVTSAERMVHSTPGEIVATTVDARPGTEPALVAAVSDRSAHDQWSIVRVPLAGAAKASAPSRVPGWPTAVESGSQGPAVAAQATIEIGRDGVPRAAIIDARGRLYGGRLDGSALALVRDGAGSPGAHPQIAPLLRFETTSCFTEQGTLFHTGGH